MNANSQFDETTATKEELWAYCLKEYESRDPIVRSMLNHFFRDIEIIVHSLSPNDRILEVGCGAGESSRRILSMLSGQHFEASDYDARYVAMLHDTDFPISAIQESVLDLKHSDHAFDAVFCLEVLEHVENYRIALQELFRVSKNHLIISVPNEPLWRILNMLRGKYLRRFGNTPGHVNHWSRRRLVRLIQEFGVCRAAYTPIPWIIIHAQVE